MPCKQRLTPLAAAGLAVTLAVAVGLQAQTLSQVDPEDWPSLVDAPWGEGPRTAEKLRIFDLAWNALDDGYGAFMNLEVDLDALRTRYRTRIIDGVSMGRFVAMLNHLSLAMKDAHTTIVHGQVNYGVRPLPGLPVFVVGAWLDVSHFGAALTPMPDGSLLVLRAVSEHPLGLERGDLVLGYDGVPWRDLYPQVLAAELPITVNWVWGSTDASMEHALLMSAGMNWHLFDTIDVLKHRTGETLHLATAPLEFVAGDILGNEQLPVPGVPMPDLLAGDGVSWGIVEGTDIGYIYVSSWSWLPEHRISEQFYEAVHALMYDHDTVGMIVDFRLNTGGYMLMAHAGYSLLFDTEIAAVAFDVRGDPDDHLSMVPHPTFTAELFTIPGDPGSYYDRPIAVLTGPGAVSNGDWESLRMQLHPMVRVFGKPSNGAFTPSDNPSLGDDWYFSRATGSGYLVNGHVYLAHTAAPVDEEVWLTREDVIEGRDTVVEAARAWILHQRPRRIGGRF